jgi:hypothetical protein
MVAHNGILKIAHSEHFVERDELLVCTKDMLSLAVVKEGGLGCPCQTLHSFDNSGRGFIKLF